MAESAVSYAIEKLHSFLAAEAELQSGLKRDLESLESELGSINTVLRDADRQADQRSDVKEWLRQVRKMAYQIEDVIDKYLLLKLQARDSHQPELEAVNDCKVCILRLGNKFLKAIRWVLQLKPKHDLAYTLKNIKAELVEIQRRKESYSLVPTNSSHDDQRHECREYRVNYSTYLKDSEILGIDKPKSEVISKLYKEWYLIGVEGMGGAGKTTLVRKVFEDMEVRQHFGLNAWVTVSQTYKPVDVLRSISQAVNCEVDNIANQEIIINKLREFLQEQHNQRYLIVLDDIWDTHLLPYIKDALPPCLDGRILMTTRKIDVANNWAKSLSGHVHQLDPLPENEAWDLFCIKTFEQRECPQELEELSHRVVDKCEGLPLAIVAIGGFLSTKGPNHSNLSKLVNSIGSELTIVERILLLSYHELPYYLKSCFLYFGLLPEDYTIAHRRLIRIWMADGLLEPQRGKTPEEVGEEYMMQLIHRNLVQVADANVTGRHLVVHVHDIVREIIISQLEETGFGGNSSMDSQFRRLAIDSSNNNNFLEIFTSKGNGHKCKIRSLISIDIPGGVKIESLVKYVPLLKVLELEGALIAEIPEEVGNLHLLRLLNLRDTAVTRLPKSIGRLVNLETLDMRRCRIRELPKEMSQLYKLRYLCAFRLEVPTKVVQNLKELQKLEMIDIGGEKTRADAAGMILNELRNLKELRKFGIIFRRENMVEVSSLISEMQHLESLHVETAHEDEIMDLQIGNKETLCALRCVYIRRGIMHKLPEWVSQLVNLVSLGLVNSRLKEDPLPILGRLPNLAQLVLCECYEGEQLDVGTSGFPKLQRLEIWGMKELKSIIGSAPPLLQQGDISDCPNLEEVPAEMKHLLQGFQKFGSF